MRRLLQWAAHYWALLGPWPEVKVMPETEANEAPPVEAEHPDMTTCDRCCAAAAYRYQRSARAFRLCGHHAAEHVDAIVEQGWYTYTLNNG